MPYDAKIPSDRLFFRKHFPEQSNEQFHAAHDADLAPHRQADKLGKRNPA